MRTASIYFYVLPIENGGYQHNLISLAQGLQQMGIAFAASANYWKQEDGSYLFQYDPDLKQEDFDLHIVSEQYVSYGNGEFPEGYFEQKGKKIYIHCGDGLQHQYNLGKLKSFYSQFDYVFLHQYGGVRYPKHFFPWAFGISQHIIDLAQWEVPKSNQVCLNYRNSHSVRKLASERIFEKVPELLDQTREMDDWQAWGNSENYQQFCVFQSAGRHALAYNHRIGSSLATACFGGVFFIKPLLWNWPAFKLTNYFVQSAASVGRMQSLATKLGVAKAHTYRVYQWDSWRFWETFANESVAVHLDLGKYKVILPEMPISGKHYLGVDLQNPAPSLKLLKNTAQMREIGVAGRKWALEHYGPQAQANRLLKIVKA